MSSPRSNKSFAIQIPKSVGEDFYDNDNANEKRPFEVKTPEVQLSPRGRHLKMAAIKERDMTEKKLFSSCNERALNSARKEMGSSKPIKNNLYLTQRPLEETNLERLDESKRSTP